MGPNGGNVPIDSVHEDILTDTRKDYFLAAAESAAAPLLRVEATARRRGLWAHCHPLFTERKVATWNFGLVFFANVCYSLNFASYFRF
jgi:hypothetical protein